MAAPFTRQLGSQPGVQVNPVQDRTDGFTNGTDDQRAAIPMRASRGRIDRPFLVAASTFTERLGAPPSLRASLLNEAYVHAYEAVRFGAQELVVARLTVAGETRVKWAVLNAANGASPAWSVSDTEPSSGFTIAFKHLECFNDGLYAYFHAVEAVDEQTLQPVATERVRLVVADPFTDKVILFAEGSLNPDAVDEFGQSQYLPDVVELVGNENWIVRIGDDTVSPDSDAYGLDQNGRDREIASDLLVCFDEGGTGYSNADYDRAVDMLKLPCTLWHLAPAH